MSDAVAAPAPAASAQPSAVARVTPAHVEKHSDPGALAAKEMRERRKVRLAAKDGKTVEPIAEASPPTPKSEPAEPKLELHGDDVGGPQEALEHEQPAEGDAEAEAKAPWAQKIKADLADATSKLEKYEQERAGWEQAHRQVKFAIEDAKADAKFHEGIAQQLLGLLEKVAPGRFVKESLDLLVTKHEMGKVQAQLQRGQGQTAEEQQAARIEHHATGVKQAFAKLGERFPELRGAKIGTPAGDFLELQLARWARTGDLADLERQATAWVATHRGMQAKPAAAAQPSQPARVRPDASTLAGSKGGGVAPARPSNKFVDDKTLKAELASRRQARG